VYVCGICICARVYVFVVCVSVCNLLLVRHYLKHVPALQENVGAIGYIYIYIYMYIYVHVCVYVYARVHVSVCVYVCV